MRFMESHFECNALAFSEKKSYYEKRMAIGSECLRDKWAEAHMFISETQTPVEVKRFLFLWCLI